MGEPHAVFQISRAPTDAMLNVYRRRRSLDKEFTELNQPIFY